MGNEVTPPSRSRPPRVIPGLRFALDADQRSSRGHNHPAAKGGRYKGAPKVSVASYRQIGGRLGDYIHANNPSSQQIQALLADLLAGDELLSPMRDMVARPLFLAVQRRARTSRRPIERDALLQDMGRFYLPSVIEAAGQLLDGILDSPDNQQLSSNHKGTSSSSSASIQEPRIQPSTPAAGPVDPWATISDPTNARAEATTDQSRTDGHSPKRLNASQICDENLWNNTRDPEKDKRFLEAWNLRWFNKKYRPRLEKD